MRVSTTMVYDAGIRKVSEQTGNLMKLQQQIATGRRIVTPADDPVAAARTLELTQADDVVTQFARNRDSAQSSLGLQESQLTGVGELITRVRELAVQLGNGSLTQQNRSAITVELRARYEELLGYANSKDGNGKYIFSGYMGDTQPYTGSVETGATYSGDDGQRQLQVSPSRLVEVSDSGRSIFERIRNGNGYFVTGAGIPEVKDPVTGSVTQAYIQNPGTGIIDSGNITDPKSWANAINNFSAVRVQFSVDTSIDPPRTMYDVVVPDSVSPQDLTSGTSLLTGLPIDPATPTPFSQQRVYSSGQSISLNGLVDPTTLGNLDLGATVAVSGDPINRDQTTGRPIDPATKLPLAYPVPVGTTIAGDVFTITPSQTQSIFDTLRTLILHAEQPTGTSSDNALLSNRIGFALTNLDQVEVNVLRVRSLVGSRLNEIESLQSVNEDLHIQYQQTISSLQDLDYAKTISDFTRKQTDLEAAQKSFIQVTQLSLFKYI